MFRRATSCNVQLVRKAISMAHKRSYARQIEELLVVGVLTLAVYVVFVSAMAAFQNCGR
jgi:hypothetical protein